MLDLQLPSGGLLIIEPSILGTVKAAVQYAVFPGHRTPEPPGGGLKSVFNIGDQYPDAGVTTQLHGGQDATNPAQYHDLPYGPYTVCVTLVELAAESILDFQCRQLVIDSDEPEVIRVDLGGTRSKGDRRNQ